MRRPILPGRRPRPTPEDGQSRLATGDLLDEALAGVSARPARLVLTTLGTVLGIGSLVATIGLGQTAAGQIGQRFDAVAATRVVVEPRQGPTPGGGSQPLGSLPWDAADRVARLNGVVAAGTYTAISPGELRVQTTPVFDPTGAGEQAPPVIAASSGLLDALRGELLTGRAFDPGHDSRADPVALVGADLARRLNLTRIDALPAVFIDDHPFTIIGIINRVAARGHLLDAVVIPNGAARELLGVDSPATLEIRTALGAAQLIGRQAPIALSANRPETLRAETPPVPTQLRRHVQADVGALFLVLGAVALLIGGLGIANVTLLSVLERIGEIGLRRALGATRRHVAGQFLLESVTIGFLGGLVGSAAGVLITLGVSTARSWTPLLDFRLAALAPLLGAAIGLAAGTYPAWKASAIEPIAALHGHN
jgi:putative ABC transport system permease protein